jgi:hypothetical protein
MILYPRRLVSGMPSVRLFVLVALACPAAFGVGSADARAVQKSATSLIP